MNNAKPKAETISLQKSASADKNSKLPSFNKKEILRERARLLATKAEENKQFKKQLEVVEFKIDKELYGIETQSIVKVHTLQDLTSLPGVPNFIVGIINVHGQIIPVIDIKKFFDLPAGPITEKSKAIIIQTSDIVIGILADEVLRITYVEEDELQNSLPTLTGIRSDYLKGITLDQMVILDPTKLCLDKRILVDQEN